MTEPYIRFCTLASGSSGNAIYCDNAEGAILIDAGISCRRLNQALTCAGGEIDRVDGIVITHHHQDHLKGAGAICRRHGMPLFLTQGTLSRGKRLIGKVPGHRLFAAGTRLCLGGFTIETIPTPHDAEEPVALILEHHGIRLGIFTDLGEPFDELRESIRSLDGLILESNYDPQMLEAGDDPPSLKNRIRGPRGHISNGEAAEMLQSFGSSRLQNILLAHLSDRNNCPETALSCHQDLAAGFLKEYRPTLSVAPRDEASPLYTLSTTTPTLSLPTHA